jgi:DNA modification methylase
LAGFQLIGTRTGISERIVVKSLTKPENRMVSRPVKPVAMVADALLDSSARGEVVVDAFLGSGTTLMAAERVGRICCGIELDPAYVDVAIRRWQQQMGEQAVHVESGKKFEEISKEMEVVREK